MRPFLSPIGLRIASTITLVRDIKYPLFESVEAVIVEIVGQDLDLCHRIEWDLQLLRQAVQFVGKCTAVGIGKQYRAKTKHQAVHVFQIGRYDQSGQRAVGTVDQGAFAELMDPVDRCRGTEVSDDQIGEIFTDDLRVAEVLSVKRDRLEQQLGDETAAGVQRAKLPIELTRVEFELLVPDLLSFAKR